MLKLGLHHHPQRTDKTSTKFLVPDGGGYGSQLAVYLNKVNNQLNIFQGRGVCGTQGGTSQFMGRNTVGKVPHEIAALLSLPDPHEVHFPRVPQDKCNQGC